MEDAQTLDPNDPIHTQELHSCSYGASLSFPSISPSSDQDGGFNEHYMERLLEIETELMDFDSILASETNPSNAHEVQESSIISSESHEEGSVGSLSLTDLLLMGAEVVEAQNWPLASTIVAKLNDLLADQEPTKQNSSLNRVALFFTQGLHCKITNTVPETLRTQQTRTMSAFQLLQELSPYVKFSHFTANQAILEAAEGGQELHVIDLDIMEGLQWPPLMVDLAVRKSTLRITATITDPNNAGAVLQTGRRLGEFADSIDLPFMFDHLVLVKTEDFDEIKVGRTLVANCMIHQLHMPNSKSSLHKLMTFLGGIAKLAPKVVVLVEDELFNFTKLTSMSFVEFFCEAFHHYASLSDSLASGFEDGYRIGLRQIEDELLRMRIIEGVGNFPVEERVRVLWREAYGSLKQFRQVPVSFCNISQARSLVSLFSGGYRVQHDGCRLGLWWKSRLLTTASIWVPL